MWWETKTMRTNRHFEEIITPSMPIMEIRPETLIYGILPDTLSRVSVFANGGADAQRAIFIPKIYSKPIPYSNTSLIPKFDKKYLKRNRLAFY